MPLKGELSAPYYKVPPLFIVGSFNDLVKFSTDLLQFVVCSKGAAEKFVVHNKSSWVTFSPHQSSSSHQQHLSSREAYIFNCALPAT